MITLRVTENEVAITKRLLARALTEIKTPFTSDEKSIMRLYYNQLEREKFVDEEVYESYEVSTESTAMYGLR